MKLIVVALSIGAGWIAIQPAYGSSQSLPTIPNFSTAPLELPPLGLKDGPLPQPLLPLAPPTLGPLPSLKARERDHPRDRMPILAPRNDVDFKLTVKTPEPNVDYKLLLKEVPVPERK